MKTRRRCAPPFFFAILEKPEGGGAFKRPSPPAGRGLIRARSAPLAMGSQVHHVSAISRLADYVVANIKRPNAVSPLASAA